MSNSTTTFIALRGIVFLRELENSTRRICSIDTTALQESDQTRLQILPHDERVTAGRREI